jgi:hypothetical protein
MVAADDDEDDDTFARAAAVVEDALAAPDALVLVVALAVGRNGVSPAAKHQPEERVERSAKKQTRWVQYSKRSFPPTMASAL